MKGQAESIAFILLFVISITFFAAATLWSRDIFQENLGIAKLEASEKFMKELDKEISNVIKFGGSSELEYNIGGTIQLMDQRTIRVRTPISLDLPSTWFNITSDTSYIQEKKEVGDLLLQLIYPPGDYDVEFFTDGDALAQPSYIKIERDSTVFNPTVIIKIKISFL